MMETNSHEQADRMKILEMIASRKITPDEGAELLGAVSKPKQEIPTRENTRDPRWFRVRVTDTFSGKPKAIVNIPMGLMDWGLKLGAQFAPEVSDVNLDELRDILHSGFEGKIIDVIDEEDGEQVEIFID
jgi:hypothetical protein